VAACAAKVMNRARRRCFIPYRYAAWGLVGLLVVAQQCGKTNVK